MFDGNTTTLLLHTFLYLLLYIYYCNTGCRAKYIRLIYTQLQEQNLKQCHQQQHISQHAPNLIKQIIDSNVQQKSIKCEYNYNCYVCYKELKVFSAKNCISLNISCIQNLQQSLQTLEYINTEPTNLSTYIVTQLFYNNKLLRKCIGGRSCNAMFETLCRLRNTSDTTTTTTTNATYTNTITTKDDVTTQQQPQTQTKLPYFEKSIATLLSLYSSDIIKILNPCDIPWNCKTDTTNVDKYKEILEENTKLWERYATTVYQNDKNISPLANTNIKQLLQNFLDFDRHNDEKYGGSTSFRHVNNSIIAIRNQVLESNTNFKS